MTRSWFGHSESTKKEMVLSNCAKLGRCSKSSQVRNVRITLMNSFSAFQAHCRKDDPKSMRSLSRTRKALWYRLVRHPRISKIHVGNSFTFRHLAQSCTRASSWPHATRSASRG